ncbi:hypothetical protein J7E29_16780 [Streptomyces sp. ISL-90]|nr:hypothetical protein [Streptomyces sp. ISL-90]
MTDQGDGIDEALEGVIRVVLTAAGRVGERLARVREEFAREARARSEKEARELQARYDAERGAARAELRPVHESEWWDRADAATIARAHEVATAWRGQDPDAAAASDRIQAEVRERFGFDVNETGELSSQVFLATEEAAQARSQETAERARATQEAAEAQLLLAEANALDEFAKENRARADELARGIDWESGDQAYAELFERSEESRATADEQQSQSTEAASRAAELYDSSERRQQFANDLASKGANADQVRDRLLSDVDQAKHPREAVGARTGGAKARPTRGITGAARDRARGR